MIWIDSSGYGYVIAMGDADVITAWALSQSDIKTIGDARAALSVKLRDENRLLGRDAADGLVSIHNKLAGGWPGIWSPRNPYHDVSESIEQMIISDYHILALGEKPLALEAFYAIKPPETEQAHYEAWEKVRLSKNLPEYYDPLTTPRIIIRGDY